MQTVIQFLNAATPFIAAFTALLVIIHGWKLNKIQKQTNGMQGIMMKLAKKEGAQEESNAQKVGQTTVDTPPSA